MNIPAPVMDDQAPLVGGSDHEGQELFQPNPFWGSQANRFK